MSRAADKPADHAFMNKLAEFYADIIMKEKEKKREVKDYDIQVQNEKK